MTEAITAAVLRGPPPLPADDVETLPQLLERAHADERSGEAGLRFLDRRERAIHYGWRKIIDDAQAQAGYLVGAGVERGERVALFFPTGVDFFVAFFATQLAGAVPVPLYPPLRLGQRDGYERRTAGLLAAAETRLALASDLVRRSLGGTLEHYRPALGVRTLEELAALPAAEPFPVDGEDVALVQFSSGTTGEPKPVALSHRALLYQARLLEGLWPDEDGRRHSGVSWLPLYHDMGLIGCVLPALRRPADLTLLRPELFVARPASWLRAVSRYRATVSAAPNFAYALCVEKVRDEELEGVDLSGWTSALSGAEMVSPRVLRSFAERFARWGLRREALTPVYGLAEAALAVTFSAFDEPFSSRPFDRRALASGRALPATAPGPSLEVAAVGQPLPGFEVALRDGDRRLLAEGEVGHVWIRGPSLMQGYLGRPGATADVLVDGWLDSGDLGFVCAGELYLCGRAKDLLLLRGRKWSPEPVERAIADVPGIESSAAVAVTHLPADGESEALWLLVERARGVPVCRDRLARQCRERVLAETGLRVAEVIVLAAGELPRTSSGKLRRQAALRELVLGRLRLAQRIGR